MGSRLLVGPAGLETADRLANRSAAVRLGGGTAWWGRYLPGILVCQPARQVDPPGAGQGDRLLPWLEPRDLDPRRGADRDPEGHPRRTDCRSGVSRPAVGA